jgi:serine protease Do
MKAWKIIFVVGVAGALAACQTTQGPDGSVSLGGSSGGTSSYNVFWDQTDHLKELVAAKQWEKVASLYRKESGHFQKHLDDAAVTTGLRAAADALPRRRVPALVSSTKVIEAVTWPAPPKDWSGVKSTIAGAERELASSNNEPIFEKATSHQQAQRDLKAAIGELEGKIKKSAGALFAEFDIEEDQSFFAIYPVVLSVPRTIDAAMPALLPKLMGSSPTTIATFLREHGDRLAPEQRKELAAVGFQAFLRQESGGQRPSLDTVLSAYAKAKTLGIEPGRLDEPRISFVEITSRTLLKEGRIEFPAVIDIDLPVDAGKADLDAALASVASENLDYLVVFDVAVARSFRRVATQEKISSQYQSGVRHEPNPARTTRQIAVQTAQANVQQVEFRASTGCIGCGLIPAMIHAGIMNGQRKEARQALNTAISNLESEAVSLEKPVWSDYQFNRAHIDAKKVMSINYYVMDLRERAYFKSFVTVNEAQEFVVPYRLHDKDRNRASHLNGAQREKDVEAFEEASVSIKLTEILDHYRSNRGKWKKTSEASDLAKSNVEGQEHRTRQIQGKHL